MTKYTYGPTMWILPKRFIDCTVVELDEGLIESYWQMGEGCNDNT